MSTLVETVTAVLSEAPSYTVVDNTNTKVSSFETFIKALENKLNLDLSNAVKRSKLELESLYDAFKNRNYKITAAYFFSKNYNALQEIGYKSHWISLTDKKGKEIEILYKKEAEEEEKDPFFSFDNSDYRFVSVQGGGESSQMYQVAGGLNITSITNNKFISIATRDISGNGTNGFVCRD
jgi:hypothetical protein